MATQSSTASTLAFYPNLTYIFPVYFERSELSHIRSDGIFARRHGFGATEVSLQWVHDHPESMERRLNHAALAYLRKSWPNPVHLSPTRLGNEFSPESKTFVRIVQALIDEGLLSVEFFLIGTGNEPTARDAILTRKGVTSTADL